jgi:hypothetical protein
MCERLDTQSGFTVSRYDRFLRRKLTSQIAICDLWVVGSYARGASECGDLDVLIFVKCDVSRPYPHEIAKEAFGRLVDVRFYVGTPQENSSGVPFPEAVHLWGNGVDWRSAIASIKEDPTATRFSRPTDAIPLRSEQLYAEADSLEEVVGLEQQGLLAWQFLPYGVMPHGPALSDPEERLGRIARSWGAKTRELLPFLLAYIRQCVMPLTRVEQESGVRELDIGGMLIGLGRPQLPYRLLDELIYSRIALFPHQSRRGPNGIWELRRGKRHPIELAAADLGAYVEVDESNVLCNYVYVGGAGYPEGPGIDLFVAEERARETLDEMDRPWPTALRHIRGSELLDLISCADVVDIYHGEEEMTTIPLRRPGAAARADGGKVDLADTDSALATLREHLTVGSRAEND